MQRKHVRGLGDGGGGAFQLWREPADSWGENRRVSCVCATTDLTDAAEIGVVTQVPDAHPESPVPAFHRVDRVLGLFSFFFSFGSFEWFGRASARHYPCLDPGLKDTSQNVGLFLFSSPLYYSRWQDVTLGLTLPPLDLVLRPSPDMWYGFTHRG